MTVRAILRREGRALWSDGRGWSLVAVAVAWGLLTGARMILPVMIPYLQSTFRISLSIAGLLVSVLWFFGAVGQLPGGVLADTYSERTLMATSAIVVATAIAAFLVSPTPAFLFAATALWGVAHSLYPVSRITFLSTSYADRLGSALGVTMATGDVGQTILPPIAAVLAVTVAWQLGLGFVVPLLVLAGAFIYVTLPSRTASPSIANPSTSSLQTVRDAFSTMRTPSIGFMTVILFLYIFIWQSFTAFYPTYLMTTKGLSAAAASSLFGFFFAVGVIVKPLAGAAYDRFGIRASLGSVLVPAAVGFGLLPFIDNIWLLVVTTALASVMLGSGTITQSYLAESFAAEVRGTGLGVVRSVTLALGAGGPVVFGVMADAGYFDEGYVALAAIVAVTILLVLRMPRR